MAILELYGSEKLLVGARASLNGDVSAVVVRSVAGDELLSELSNLVGFTSNVQDLATLAVKNALPVAQTEEIIDQWSEVRNVKSKGFGHAYVRAGKTVAHVDYSYLSPFVISLGVRGSAIFRTQLLGNRDVAPNGYTQFDYTKRVDKFCQNPGDVVFIPGSPARSVHAVEADDQRLACIVAPNLYSFDR